MAHSAPYLGLSSHWTALFAFLWSFFSFHLCFSVFFVVFFTILCTLQYISNVRRAVQHTQHSWFKSHPGVLIGSCYLYFLTCLLVLQRELEPTTRLVGITNASQTHPGFLNIKDIDRLLTTISPNTRREPQDIILIRYYKEDHSERGDIPILKSRSPR
jgi:hypothetical protein